MNNKSRSTNSARNIAVSLLCQAIYLALAFIGRSVFVRTLGAEYTGINGLFSNIIAVLSLAELGIGNVMIFSFYQPIHENNATRIVELLKYFKKIYIAIAIGVAFLGLVTMPFLKFIITSDIPMDKIYLYYIAFLLNSVCSYLYAHRIALINADQRVHTVRLATLAFQVIQNIVQIILLITTKSFLLYLAIQFICTIALSVFLGAKTKRLYPFLAQKVKPLSRSNKSVIFKKIKATILYKISIVLMNNTDNILISILIGTISVGFYSNYSLVISTVNSLIGLVISAIIPSIGNLNVSEDEGKKHQIFNVLVLIFQWITTLSSIIILFLINDFVKMWVGQEYVLDNSIVISIVLNFYISNIINPVWMYREATGLFEKTKYITAIACGINIVTSLLLGKLMGMGGIIIATAISRCLTTVWYEPLVLYRNVFKQSPSQYFISQFKYICIGILSLLLTGASVTLFDNSGLGGGIIVKGCICFIIPNLLFFISSYKKKEWKYIILVLKSMAKRIKRPRAFRR